MKKKTRDFVLEWKQIAKKRYELFSQDIEKDNLERAYLSYRYIWGKQYERLQRILNMILAMEGSKD